MEIERKFARFHSTVWPTLEARANYLVCFSWDHNSRRGCSNPECLNNHNEQIARFYEDHRYGECGD